MSKRTLLVISLLVTLAMLAFSIIEMLDTRAQINNNDSQPPVETVDDAMSAIGEGLGLGIGYALLIILSIGLGFVAFIKLLAVLINRSWAAILPMITDIGLAGSLIYSSLPQLTSGTAEVAVLIAIGALALASICDICSLFAD